MTKSQDPYQNVTDPEHCYLVTTGTSKNNQNTVPPTWQQLDRLQWQRPWRQHPIKITQGLISRGVEVRQVVLQPQI
jgi:hypothetical protein